MYSSSTTMNAGPPDSVNNLQGYQLDYCCMFISWDPPYTLPGLTVQYIITEWLRPRSG